MAVSLGKQIGRRKYIVVIVALAAPAPPQSARSDDAPVRSIDAPSAASLIGKTLDDAYVLTLAEKSKRAKSGDWTYGFDYDEGGGLARSAFIDDVVNMDLSTRHGYVDRCKRSEPTAPFALGDSAHRFTSDRASRQGYAIAWLYYDDNGGFQFPPKQQKMQTNGDAGGFDLDLDLASLLKNKRLAFCPARISADKIATRCSIYSLNGFARAFDYVCDAK